MENKPQENPEIVQVEKDLEQFVSLDSIAQSEGGKLLVDRFSRDILGAMERLSMGYGKFTLQEFMAIGAEVREKLTMVRILTRAHKNREAAKERLEELIKQ